MGLLLDITLFSCLRSASGLQQTLLWRLAVKYPTYSSKATKLDSHVLVQSIKERTVNVPQFDIPRVLSETQKGTRIGKLIPSISPNTTY